MPGCNRFPGDGMMNRWGDGHPTTNGPGKLLVVVSDNGSFLISLVAFAKSCDGTTLGGWTTTGTIAGDAEPVFETGNILEFGAW